MALARTPRRSRRSWWICQSSNSSKVRAGTATVAQAIREVSRMSVILTHPMQLPHFTLPAKTANLFGMTEYEKFPRAPITEAVLELKTKNPPEMTLETLSSIYEDIHDTYPTKTARISFRAGFKIEEGKSPAIFEPTGDLIGYSFTSSDGKQIIQALTHGFVFSRLNPYERWDTFRDEARKLWRHYKNRANPQGITRIGLRYINRIQIPLPITDFKDYVLTIPEIAPGISQSLSNFFMRLEIPQELPTMAIIMQTMEPVTSDNKLPLIFDIDVVREMTIESDDEAWECFENLRDLKNNIFSRSLTEKSKDLFRGGA
jgi:uncharacterized protein (TIGR04255 family)